MKVTDLEGMGFPAPDNVFLEDRGVSWDDTVQGVRATHGMIEAGASGELIVEEPEFVIVHKGVLSILHPPKTLPGMTSLDQHYPMNRHDAPVRMPLNYPIRIAAAKNYPRADDAHPLIYTALYPQTTLTSLERMQALQSAVDTVKAEAFHASLETPQEALTRIHAFRERNGQAGA